MSTLKLPEITYKELPQVSWPLYVIPSTDLRLEDNVLTCLGRVIDDRNQPGSNLGLRRIQTPLETYKFARGVTDLASLLACKKTTFIDYSGRIFKYKKTRWAKLKYVKIREVTTKDTCSLLWLVGCETSIVIPRPPPSGFKWAGVLYLSSEYPSIVYEYSLSQQPEKRIKL